MAALTFFPIGNADTTLIRLADDRLVLLDYANMRNPLDRFDARCDLPAELRKEMAAARRSHFAVVCFTHLDDDHVRGMGEFFWLRHATKYQGPGRHQIDELWVPAGAITETCIDDDARLVRQEARHRLLEGEGVKVFSRPELLRSFLAKNGLTVEDRASCIVDAGTTVPVFDRTGPGRVEFFVHCPFAWRTDERGLEDRNRDSIVLQATFVEGGHETYALLGSDVEYGTLCEIVKTSKKHGNEDRLRWDVMKLFHHCSYLSLGPDRGVDETVAVDEVKWLFEEQSRDGCIIVSPSKAIPRKGTEEDLSVQPPHRQASAHHRRVLEMRDGEFKVTMETPTHIKPKPFRVDITAAGAAVAIAVSTSIGTATGATPKAG